MPPPRSHPRVLALAIVGVVAVALVFQVRRWLRIDSCLDRGGQWSYSVGACDLGSRAGADDASTAAATEVLPEPQTAVHIVRLAGHDSAGPVSRALVGIRSIRIDGWVASPCQDESPLIQYSDVVTGRVALDVSLVVPLLCLPREEWYYFTAVVDHLPAGSYPLEVRLRIHSRDPGTRSSERLLLHDTVVVADR